MKEEVIVCCAEDANGKAVRLEVSVQLSREGPWTDAHTETEELLSGIEDITARKTVQWIMQPTER